uniref:Sucrose phosphatase-like domain-containing protein n=1 Tax=Chrysotila carterae TaxID=13221 RepID=A0A7S4BQA5_CHRCT
MDKPVIRAIFSDLDGTLIHFPIWFEKHGVSMSDADHEKHSAIVTNAQGESRRCRLLPKTTMGDGVVSDRTVELVAQLRKAGVLFFIVTGARKSTVLERLPFLPDADAVVGESGSRMYVEGKLDEEWQQRLLPVCGPIDRAMDPESRPEPLWKFCSLLKARGFNVDTRSYFGCFRVDTKGDLEAEKSLRALISTEMPAEINWAMNLAKFDFFPAGSGKQNAVAYLYADTPRLTPPLGASQFVNLCAGSHAHTVAQMRTQTQAAAFWPQTRGVRLPLR